MSDARLLRVLSIDGGGVRGLLPATILLLLEKKLQQKTSNPNARIADYFDLLAGTSTGGILTCMYLLPGADGRPKYTAEDVLNFYKTKMTTVFSRTLYDKVTSVWGWDGPQYSVSPYETMLKQYAGDALLSQLLRPCVLTSYNIDIGEPHFFCNSSDKKEMPYDFYVRDVARSTSAAPTYFVPSEITPLPSPSATSSPTPFSPSPPSASSAASPAPAAAASPAPPPNPEPPTFAPLHLIDGGVFANNPTLCAYAQARQMTIGNKHRVHLKDMFILSMSCGEQKCVYPATQANKWGKLGWVRPLASLHCIPPIIHHDSTPPHSQTYPPTGDAAYQHHDGRQ